MTVTADQAPLKVYWQPGCSSCLKTKEFLIANNQEFVSVNVLEGEDGFKELAALGLRMVPIVARGTNVIEPLWEGKWQRRRPDRWDQNT